MKVAVAVIVNEKQQVLITRRSPNSPHGGLWEFPGGKLEQGESASEALIREVKEEVGLDVLEYDFLGEINHSYAVKEVSLLIFNVRKYQGEALCRESQTDLRWASLAQLSSYDFPEANTEIIKMLSLSSRVSQKDKGRGLIYHVN